MESRILFYVSKLITEQMDESDQYGKIRRVISIIITDHTLIKQSEKYHHHFGLYDIESSVLLTDNLEIHTLEVPKARKVNECTMKADLLNWMKFFDAKTEEELNMLAQKSPVMKKASLRLMEISADEKARQLYEARLKEQRDYYAREKGAIFKIAKKFLDMGMSVTDVSTGTGLTHEEVEYVQNADY
jgi:predicted transposase/invertase (TIGR01784 family)